jgi:hypothetical protein
MESLGNLWQLPEPSPSRSQVGEVAAGNPKLFEGIVAEAAKEELGVGPGIGHGGTEIRQGRLDSPLGQRQISKLRFLPKTVAVARKGPLSPPPGPPGEAARLRPKWIATVSRQFQVPFPIVPAPR